MLLRLVLFSWKDSDHVTAAGFGVAGREGLEMENLDSAESDKAVETACTTNPQNPANRTNETSVPNKIKPDEFSVVKAADTNSEDRIVIDDTDLPIQCSPPSKDAEEDLIVIQDGSPKNKSDSSKSKKGTGLRKRSAFSVSNPRAGESTSSDTEEHLVQTENLVSQVSIFQTDCAVFFVLRSL